VRWYSRGVNPEFRGVQLYTSSFGPGIASNR
jgi:hypothetical protein